MKQLLRIQRRRFAGASHPTGTRFVDRSTSFGNPFEVRSEFGRSAVDWYVQVGGRKRFFPTRREAHGYAVEVFPASCRGREVEIVKALRGRHLGCYCQLCPTHADGKPLGVSCDACMPCHADSLGRIANGPLRFEGTLEELRDVG